MISINTLRAQTLVDTNKLYKNLPFGIGKNDCSVRAVATIKNIPYLDAHKTLNNLGRLNNKGINPRVLLQHFKVVNKLDTINNIKSEKVTSRRLIKKNRLDTDFDYLAISKGHIFAITYNNSKWTVYGNSDD